MASSSDWKSVKDQRLKLAAVIFSVIFIRLSLSRLPHSAVIDLLFDSIRACIEAEWCLPWQGNCANLSFIVDVSRGMGILYASILLMTTFANFFVCVCVGRSTKSQSPAAFLFR
ncbi:MAG: hypothetical protein ACLRSW_03660 [Christensenellaceae bacterium]